MSVSLEQALGLSFHNRALLTEALTHRSYLNENPSPKASHSGGASDHNERLEFLGDAVLELIVTEYLFARFPDTSEGELTSYRAALVNTNSLAETASTLGFDGHLLLSRGEAKDTGRARLYILANAFEAVVGALFLDQGYAAVQKFLSRVLLPKMDRVLEGRLYEDAKSVFQEQAQERVGLTPHYRVLEEVGPDHAKEFTVGVYLDEQMVARGKGFSKQEAEPEAARAALALE